MPPEERPAPGPDEASERFRELAEALQLLREQQAAIERRLARIEQALKLAPAGHAAKPGPHSPAAAPEAAHPALETRMGLTWINRAGVITLILGAAFFFKYAVDLGWLGEGARVALGAVSGIALIAAADGIWRRGQQTFAQGLSGAGAGILYLTVWAAYGLYRMLPQAPAFGSMAAVTAATVALALRYGSPAMAALGMIGAYLTPAVLGVGLDHPWLLFSYALLPGLAAAWLAKRRGWHVLEALAFAGATALYLLWLASFFKPGERFVAEVFALAFFALFATRDMRYLLGAAQLFAVAELALISLPQPMPFLPLAAATCAGGLAIADRRGWPEAPLAVLVGFWAPYGVAYLSMRAHGAREPMALWLTVIFLLFAGWARWRVRRGRVRWQDLVTPAASAGLYFGAVYDLLAPAHARWMGLLAAALAALHAALARGLRRGYAAALYLGTGIAFVTVAVPAQFSGYRITLGWACEAAALAWIAAREREERLSWAAVAVGALVAVRLAFADSRTYETAHAYGVVFNARFATFAGAAVCFWLASHWLRAGRKAAAAYVTGHGAAVAALVLEVAGWAGRNAAPQNLHSAMSAGTSIVLAGYAVLLVAVGVIARLAASRIAGLAIIAAVVAKLYLYDVWQVGRLYRVVAFAALGVLLLLTSYLYSRSRSEGRAR